MDDRGQGASWEKGIQISSSLRTHFIRVSIMIEMFRMDISLEEKNLNLKFNLKSDSRPYSFLGESWF